MSNRARTLLPLLGALVLGCEDPVAPVAEPDPVPETVPPPSAALTADVPEEFEQPPSIVSWSVDAGFTGDYAWAQAYMRYFANYAQQSAELWVRKGTSTIARRTGASHVSYFLPKVRTLWTDATAGLRESCGHTADAKGRHEAWHQAPLPGGKLFRWAAETRTSSDAAFQPSCATSCANMAILYGGDCDDGSGSSSGGSGTKTTGSTGSDGLECQQVMVVIYIDDKVFYEGPAFLCE